MFRIRRIYDDALPRNKLAIRQVQQIFADQFAAAPPREIAELPEKLRNPFKQRFRTVLYVGENGRGRVSGFALLLHEPVLGFGYLDFIASAKGLVGRGIGAALYETVRDEAIALGEKGVFFECLPDEPDRCRDPEIRRQNAARMRFYERYGALPIINTRYETPVPGGGDDNLPHLMFDGLDRGQPLRAELARRVVRLVLEVKYAELCPPEYVRRVVDSFRDDPVRLRPPRYRKSPPAPGPARAGRPLERIAVAINDKHDIHHIRERGYVESPVRIDAIMRQLDGSGLTETIPVKEYPLKHVLAVHDRDFVEYLRKACASVGERKSVYPYVFPIRNTARPPRELSIRAGYYCIDTFTPINGNAFLAAKRAVDCTMTTADEILRGRRIAYALVRPPGHHAEHRSFGGFCYLNNAAIAAHYFSRFGKVAIIDVDYHHGNGQQDIFYHRSDVLTLSIHGDPEFAYPYFTGFPDERGANEGEGFNINIALPEVQTGAQYHKALTTALQAVARFEPQFLVVALGLDPARGDPTGTWLLTAKDFEVNGRMLGELRLPTLVVQEGGYRTRTLGTNARSFLQGLVAGASRA